MAADLAFTFDPSSILKGVGQINDRMGQMTQNFTKSAGNLAKGVSRGVMAAAAKIGLLVAAFKGLSSVVKTYVPEIGEAFNIVKDIFFKNFLFPLRKELMPLLQRLLDWTRQNRARFVQWGQAVANVFRAVISVVKQVIEFARNLLVRIADIFKALFGDQVKTIEEAWNLITAKVAIAAIFIGNILEGIVDWFAQIAEEFGPRVMDALGGVIDLLWGIIQDIWPAVERGGKALFEGVLDSALSFIEGFLSGIDGIREPIQAIFNNIADFIEGLFEPNRFGDKIQDVFRIIGETLGRVFRDITEIVNRYLDPLLDEVANIATPLKEIATIFQNLWADLFDAEGMENMGRFAELLGTIVGRTVITGLYTLVLLIGALADGILLLVDSIKALRAGPEFVRDIGAFVRGEGKFLDIFRNQQEDTPEGAAARQRWRDFGANFNERLQAIGAALRGEMGEGGTTTIDNSQTVTASPVLQIYTYPGQSGEEIGQSAADVVGGTVRDALDEDRRRRGE